MGKLLLYTYYNENVICQKNHIRICKAYNENWTHAMFISLLKIYELFKKLKNFLLCGQIFKIFSNYSN